MVRKRVEIVVSQFGFLVTDEDFPSSWEFSIYLIRQNDVVEAAHNLHM